MKRRTLTGLFGWLSVLLWASVDADAEALSFNDDILPILSDRCFSCHGPDSAARKANLRLDQEGAAKSAPDEQGEIPIVSGKPDSSEILRRLTSADPEVVMPPPESKMTVSSQEIGLIRRWIAEGARWERHWAFTPPEKGKLPAVAGTEWPRNAIDHFVLSKLEARALRPSPPADRARLLRRLAFDLTGLAPTIEELEAFLRDDSPHAVDTVIDRLLRTPGFGERLALEWLDVARYGDTDGLFEDHPRTIYPWRDWVVRAFSGNLPYDQFISWQLAGDLYPGASVDQKLATGFLRNNPTSNEGGLIEEDYRIKYLVDRVNTTSTAFLGLTMECAQCHDHKFDPMTQREYYQFAGFFNSLVGGGNTKGAAAPILRLIEPEQRARLAVVGKEISRLETALRETPETLLADFEKWNAAENSPREREAGLVEFGKEWPGFQEKRDALAALRKEKSTIESANPLSMIAADEADPRPTFVLMRGAYDKPGPAVEPAAPASIFPFDGALPRNRLGLAVWMTDRKNPLTARVVVNRYWQMLFGTGLVKTPEDFGTQGERPSHPALLDYLAVVFMESGWDLKGLIRQMVGSATYQQSSVRHVTAVQVDPDNRLLSHASRARLPAESLRDHALAVSGLLDARVGGPGVQPYQPAELFGPNAIGASNAKFERGMGAALYRRSLYTYWKRQIPAANMRILGADGRIACRTRRERTNTPLQALVLLNDPQFVEAARLLGVRMLQEGGMTIRERLEFAFRLATSRRATEREIGILSAEYRDRYREFQENPQAARAYLDGGGDAHTAIPDQGNAAELAACAAVASMILNLDESISKS